MTRDEAVGIWAILTAAGKGAALSDESIEIRAELIRHLDATAARDAALRLARTVTWVPSVGEFCAEVEGAGLSPEDVVAEVIDLAGRYGTVRYGTGVCAADHASPAAEALVRSLGGWETVGGSDVMIVRAHGLKLASAAIERVRRAGLGLPEIEGPGGQVTPLPDLRIDRELDV